MSVPMSLLALLAEGPSYGLRLKQGFEERTGGIWPLNVGQVYASLDRLERAGWVRQVEGGDRQRLHEITEAGRERLAAWFAEPVDAAPARDQLVLKLVMALALPGVDAQAVIQAERRGAVETLQRYTLLKRDADEGDLGWLFLLDSLIFQTEARIRWLDACEARLARTGRATGSGAPVERAPEPGIPARPPRREEVLR
jgi:DNA-binding PadR family transcriptional regulator